MNIFRLLASRSLKRQNDRLKEEIEDACKELAAYDEEVNRLKKERAEYRKVLSILKESYIYHVKSPSQEMIESVLEKYKTD